MCEGVASRTDHDPASTSTLLVRTFFRALTKQDVSVATDLVEQHGAGVVATAELLELIRNDKADYAWHKVVATTQDVRETQRNRFGVTQTHAWAPIVKQVAHELPGVLDVVDDKGRCA